MENGATAEVADTSTPEATPTEAPSIDDSMSAAYDAVMAREAAEAEPVEVVEEQSEEPVAEAGEQAETEDTVQPEEAEAETEGEPEPRPSIEFPNSWTAEQREHWAAIPPATQEYIVEREKQAHGQISRMGQELSALRPVTDAFQQYQQTFARHGLTPMQGVNELLKAQEQLDRDPAGTLLAIAQRYGIDFTQLANGTTDQGEVSPQVEYLKRQVQSLESKMTASEQMTREQQEQEYQAEVARATDELKRSGIEQKPHYEELKPAIANYIATGQAQTFEEAYDKAAWADPNARKSLLDAQKKADLDAKAKAAADAKKAAKVNVGAKSKPTVAKPATWEETAAAVADRLMS